MMRRLTPGTPLPGGCPEAAGWYHTTALLPYPEPRCALFPERYIPASSRIVHRTVAELG